MSVSNTNAILRAGTFVSDGNDAIIYTPEAADIIYVLNETAAVQAAADKNCEWYYQTGMSNYGIVHSKLGTSANELTIGAASATSGIEYIDTVNRAIGSAVTISSIAEAGGALGGPRITTSAAHGYASGDLVRLYSVSGGDQLTTIDYEITKVDATKFDLIWNPAIAATGAVGAAAAVRNVKWRNRAERGRWFPKPSAIMSITTGTTTTVQLATNVSKMLSVGDTVRFNVPAIHDMTQIDGLQGKVLTVNRTDYTANNVVVDIDSTGFTAFAQPSQADITAAGGAWTPAMLIPVGQAGIQFAGLDPLDFNANFKAFRLAGGATGPGGASTNVMFWWTGKPFKYYNNTNTYE